MHDLINAALEAADHKSYVVIHFVSKPVLAEQLNFP